MVNDVVASKLCQTKLSSQSARNSKQTSKDPFQAILEQTISTQDKPVKEQDAPVKKQETKKKEPDIAENNKKEPVSSEQQEEKVEDQKDEVLLNELFSTVVLPEQVPVQFVPNETVVSPTETSQDIFGEEAIAEPKVIENIVQSVDSNPMAEEEQDSAVQQFHVAPEENVIVQNKQEETKGKNPIVEAEGIEQPEEMILGQEDTKKVSDVNQNKIQEPNSFVETKAEPLQTNQQFSNTDQESFGNEEQQEAQILQSPVKQVAEEQVTEEQGNQVNQTEMLDNHYIASKANMATVKEQNTDVEKNVDLSASIQVLNKVDPSQLNKIVSVSDVQQQQKIVLTNPEEVNQKLSDSMVQKILNGAKEFELQLEPANLGKLTIKVVYEAGKTAVSIVCSNPKSLEALAQQSKEIGMMMEEKLGEPTVVVIEDKGTPDYLEQERQNQQNQSREQQEERSSKNQQTQPEERTGLNFLQQLRLGLA